MAKLKIRQKFKHSRTLEDDFKNTIVIKNKLLKKKKKGKKASERNVKGKGKGDDMRKILNLANKQNEEEIYSDYGYKTDEENSEQVDKFLEFNDDIEEQISDNTKIAESNNNADINELDKCNNILEDLNIKINKKVCEKTDRKSNKKEHIDPPEQGNKLNSLVEKCYKTIGEVLAQYKKGKLHKALTLLVKSPKWFDLLLLTNPKEWTTQATFEVTKLFSSGLKEKDVYIYYEHILLPIILENIEENKKLDSFLYKTLIKALYKSKAWFKGILFPVLQMECTKKQLIIFGSVIQKMSISINTVIDGLNEIFTFPWNTNISYLLIIFFNKKYAFSKEFIKKCVEYFVNFEKYADPLTINWHKSLLTLVQNYRGLMEEVHIDKLKFLLKKKNHPLITSEILKYMYSSTSLINSNALMHFI
ncbi:essential nuclear protein 1, putative [Plasmodium malariae]|uniref:Essential nuclear protein 1, putative n=1 Tax=Plasmodium malariae TaxID=5858 RepID=A0A1D3PBI1_PLAMA|nr:essential nuclear protein 1, putative [Plasmodium malariae]SCN12620.1 essential nuclear protein 1, putative [Plasmodium malariae]